MPSVFPTIGIILSVHIAYVVLKEITNGIRAYVMPCLRWFQIDLKQKYGSWAVVTGSTDGIGLAYAHELANRGINIVLISRSLEKLRKVSQHIEQKYSVKTKIIVVDFSKGGPSVYETIKAGLENILVGILVNNVGVSVHRPRYLCEMSQNQIWDTINVNSGAAASMTRIILPQMQERGKGAIVFVSVLHEGYPSIHFPVHTASKTFIQNFADSIRYENGKNGITVQTLSPALVISNSSRPMLLSQTSSLFAPTAAEYARQAVRTLGVADHTTGYWPHSLQLVILKLLPFRLSVSIMHNAVEKLRKNFFLQIKND